MQEPLFHQHQQVRIRSLQADGVVGWTHWDDDLKPPRWIYYVRYRDRDGLVAGRYFEATGLEAIEAPDTAAA